MSCEWFQVKLLWEENNMFGRGTFGNRNVKKKMELKTLIINRETPLGGLIKIKQKQMTQRLTTLCRENISTLKTCTSRA